MRSLLRIGALAATRNAVDLIGAADRFGSVKPDHYADQVAVAGDPLQNPGRLEHVDFVMKGGVTYKQNGQATAQP